MLNRIYELETASYRSSIREAELKESVKQAKFNLRQATIAQVEYGGIRAFVDKLSGKHADKMEALSLEVRKAEAELHSLQRQLEAEKQKLSALQEQRTALPPLEELQTEETKDLWAPLERRYCAEALLPLLTRVEEALGEYRQMLRGEYPILSISDQSAIGAAPIAAAEKCRPLLNRLEAVQDLPEAGFFRSPAAFLAAAARHNQLELAAAAADQTAALKNHLTQSLN